MSRQTLSVVIICKNAGAQFRSCLESAQWADEIIVLDSGSTDGSEQLAASLGAKVFHSDDWPGFGPQRQRAQSYATSQWILALDTDEVITTELQSAIEQLLATEPDPGIAYRILRANDFFGRFIRHSGWGKDWVTRLYAREQYQYNDALVHEKLDCPDEKRKKLSGCLLHYTTQDFASYMQKSLRYAGDWANEKAAKGKRTTVAGIILHTVGAFIRRYFLQRGFLDGKHGLLLAMQSCHYTFNKYFALWIEVQRKQHTKQ